MPGVVSGRGVGGTWCAFLSACLAIGLVWLGGCAAGSGAAPADRPPGLSLDAPSAWPERIDIPLEEHHGYLFLPVWIDGKTAGMFLLDTGASLDVVATGVAGRLRLPESGREGEAVGVGGTASFGYRHAESMRFGPFDTGPKEIAAVDLQALSRRTGFTVAGILGFRTMSSAPFTIDYAGPTLTLYRPDRFVAPDSPYVTYRRLGGVSAVTAEVGRGRAVWMILDTGDAGATTITSKALEQWPELLAEGAGIGQGRSQGVGGTVTTRDTWLRELRVGRVIFPELEVSFEPLAAQLDRLPTPTGRIGGDVLRRVRLTFDPRNRRVYFEPRRSRTSAEVPAQALPGATP
ncbi:MAG: retropepsin-like aspartic protease [Planctomycetota bacterium]